MIQVLSLCGRGGVRPCGESVGRPSALGNPFVVGRNGTREEVIARYRRWLRAQWRRGRAVRQELERLAAQDRRDGRLTLLCWCAPRPCHADVVREAVLGICAKAVQRCGYRPDAGFTPGDIGDTDVGQGAGGPVGAESRGQDPRGIGP